MKELVLSSYSGEKASIKNHLLPALKHPNCNLIKLSLLASQEHSATGKNGGGYVLQAPCVVFVTGAASEEKALPVEAIADGDVQIGGAALI
ncbi:hypothetical protein BASA81_007872 [Batrachochytrium salamandrivorans]|nr:hypothetical protein BASA81_007872 [Batrachochytrium salamandrivorans]